MKPQEIYEILEKEYFGENIHESQEIATLQELIKGIKVFVDVGASLGQYTYYANKTIKNGVIYAIEADPVRYKRLLELSKIWESESTNKINVIHAAVSDRIGEIKFFTSNSNISGGLFTREIAKAADVQWEEITVKSITLDSLLSDIIVDFIKIDVEGAEYRVIRGAEKILRDSKPRIFMEIHSWYDKDVKHFPQEVFNIFYGYKYSFSEIHHHFLFTKKQKLGLKEHLMYMEKFLKQKIKKVLKYK